jgi:hypothetical protein
MSRTQLPSRTHRIRSRTWPRSTRSCANGTLIAAPQDQYNLERDIEAKGPPTQNWIRSKRSELFDEYLKDVNQGLAHFPLKSGGVTADGQNSYQAPQAVSDVQPAPRQQPVERPLSRYP